MEWEVFGKENNHITVFNGRQLRIDLPNQIDGENAEVDFNGDTATISYGSKKMRFSLGSMASEIERNF